MKYLFGFIFSVFLISPSLASNEDLSDESDSGGAPDLPGYLVMDFGWSNFYKNNANGNTINAWESRTLNVYYFYDKRIGNTPFTIAPGIGMGMDRYSFTNNQILTQAKDENGNKIITQSRILHNNVDTVPYGDVSYSKLVANYLEIPIELSYHFNKADFDKSIRITVGAKIGLLVDSKNKYKYSADGDTRVIKEKIDLQLNPYRFGVYGRVEFNWFSLFYYQQMTTTWKKEKALGGTEATPYQFGMSLRLF